MSAEDFYAPNQQVVREDGSGPAEEGDGGNPDVINPEADPEPDVETSDDPLDDMTKAELLDEAGARGVDANESMTKAEITDAIRAG